MVFCLIGVVGIAIIYFVGLWIRQLFLCPRRDKEYPGEPPPRALSGNGALPVYGHTRLFARLAGDVALLFPADWLEIKFLPAFMQRRLGDCFAIFIWGQWRIAIKGNERATAVLSNGNLRQGWPWTPPKTLLGKSCICFLDDDAANQLRIAMQNPLSHEVVLRYAPVFAELAEKCIDDIQNGVFRRNRGTANKQAETAAAADVESNAEDNEDDSSNEGRTTPYKIKWEAMQSYTYDIVNGPLLALTKSSSDADKEGKRKSRSKDDLPSRDTMMTYMERMKRGLDVIKITFGPEWMYVWILNEYGRALNARMHVDKILQKHVAYMARNVPVKRQRGHSYNEPSTGLIPLLTLRKNMLRNSEDIFGSATRKNSDFTANRRRTQSAPDIFDGTQSGPDIFLEIMADSDEIKRSYRSIASSSKNNDDFVASRRRTQSAPDVFLGMDSKSDDGAGYDTEPPQIVAPPELSRAQTEGMPFVAATANRPMSTIPARPKSPSPTSASWIDQWITSEAGSVPPTNVDESKNTGSGCNERPAISMGSKCTTSQVSSRQALPSKTHAIVDDEAKQSSFKLSSSDVSALMDSVPTEPESIPRKKAQTMSLLERILRQQSHDGQGVSRVVMTEISIMLWMMLDAGNAWTAMALNLLSADGAACELVQNEIHTLEAEFGYSQLFSPTVLGKMKYLDALIYEAIRLCPPFLGGLKVMSETVVLSDDDIQIPKGSNVFFCQPTERNFNLRQALGKRPEDLGENYPSIELFGFLPFEGLEVPLMVLQSKVFLATLLRRFTPCTSNRKTFIRRVKTAVEQTLSKSPMRTKRKVTSRSADEVRIKLPFACDGEEVTAVSGPLPTVLDPEVGRTFKKSDSNVTPEEAMRLFTKLPFPEPRQVFYLIPHGNEDGD